MNSTEDEHTRIFIQLFKKAKRENRKWERKNGLRPVRVKNEYSSLQWKNFVGVDDTFITIHNLPISS